jgi:hypothetical protein
MQKLDIQNTGNRPIFDVPLAFSYNQHIYCLSQHMIRLPVLIPGVLYCNEVAVNAIADGGGVSDGATPVLSSRVPTGWLRYRAGGRGLCPAGDTGGAALARALCLFLLSWAWMGLSLADLWVPNVFAQPSAYSCSARTVPCQ